MQTDYLIAINEFCVSHNIKSSFISSLEKTGLIKIITIREDLFIEADQLRQLEKIVRLYFELDINLEGIETITYLLNRISNLQSENQELKNRIRLYESDEALE
jgi:chaperone modulatory protein CbpM